MSRWGSVFRIAATAVYSYFSGNWAALAAQIESERQRRLRDKRNQRARAAFDEAQKDRLEMVDVVPDAPRSLVLGRVRYVEGVRRRWSSGTNDEKLTLIVSFAGHEIDGIEQWYLDDIPVTLDGSGYVQSTSTGTAEAYTTTAAGFAVGTTSIPLITGTGTIGAGDLLQINGDPTYYTVSTGISAPGTIVIAAPGLLKAIPASATAVSLVRAPWMLRVAEPAGSDGTLDGSGGATATVSASIVAGSATAVWTSGSSDSYETGAVSVSVSGTTATLSGGRASAAYQLSYMRVASTPYVRIRPYLGTDSQNIGDAIDSEYPGKISSTDKFAGIAAAVVDLIYSPDVFPQGPPTVTAVMRGAKVYDPRLDDTVIGASTSTWNAADKDADVTLSNSDRTASVTAANGAVRGEVGRDASADRYFEVTIGGDDRNQMVGIGTASATLSSFPGGDANGYSYYLFNGQKYTNNAGAAYTTSGSVGDVVGVRLAAGVLTFYRNGVSEGVAFTGLAGTFYPMWAPGTAGAGTRTGTINTGQVAFSALPSGSSAWGGAGGHDIEDPSTWEFSENPALHALRYAMWRSGFGLTAAQISDTTLADVIAAANRCDTSTTFTLTSPSSSVVMVRHRCGATIPADADKRQAMDSIVDTMAGEWAFDGPDLRFRAGMLGSTVAAIDQSWLVEEIQAGDSDPEPAVTATQSISREQRINRVTGKCVDPAQRYQLLPYPSVADSTLISSKGEKREEIDYPNATHPAHAQHLASIEIRRRQSGQVVQMMCDDRALFLQLFDVVSFTLSDWGISAKTYEVIGVDFPMMGAPQVMLREITAAIFDVDAELTGVDPAPDSSLRAPWSMDTLGTLTVVSGTTALQDNSIIARTLVTWPAVTDERIRNGGSIEVQFTRADQSLPSGEWESRLEPGNSSTMTITGLMTGRPYLFRGRVVQRMPLVRGPWSAITQHTMATAIATGGTVGGGNLLRNSSFEVDSDANGLADSWTAYSSGTTGSITNSRVSGGVTGGYYQRVTAAGLATGSTHQAGIYQAVELAGHAGRLIAFSPYVRGLGGGTGGVDIRIYIDFYNAAGGTGSIVDSASQVIAAADTDAANFVRYTLSARVPSTAVSCRAYVWMQNRGGSTGAAHFDTDAWQFEVGAVPTAYAPRADELLTGVVTTDNLAANAATIVHEDSNSGTFGGNTTVGDCTVVITPAHACDLIITASVDMTCSNSTGSSKLRRSEVFIEASGGIFGGGSSYDARRVRSTIADGETQEDTATCHYYATGAAAGVALTISAMGSDITLSTISTTYTRLRLRVEEIKK